jgi:hypothetical protein
MTHRRATLAIHALLVVVVFGVAASLVWMTVTYVPDPVDPWMVGPGIIALPLAALAAGGAVLVALGAWHWSRTGNRSAILAGDVAGAFGVMLGAFVLPEWFGLITVATFLVAGALVAATPRSPSARP